MAKLSTLKHIGIIMDGNGRWALRQGLERLMGHSKGLENIKNICNTCIEEKIPYLTVFAFSTENWSRPVYEINGIFSLLQSTLNKEAKYLVEHGIRLKIIGSIKKLPSVVQKNLTECMDLTKDCNTLVLTLAIDYGSRTEVIEAIQTYIKDFQSGKVCSDTLDWPTFAEYLHTRGMPDPDMIIRPSGEYRISNFLLLQSAYAELYFTPTCWPDFSPSHLREAIAWYNQRERRYGKTSAQVQTI